MIFIYLIIFGDTGNSEGVGSMKRILIVDDDEIVRKVLRKFLRQLPLEIQEATNGEEGCALLSQKAFVVFHKVVPLAVFQKVMPPVEWAARSALQRSILGRPERSDPMRALYARVA